MSTLSAGAAKASITPDENLRMAGYSTTDNLLLMPFRHRLATGVHDEIMARCLVLGDGSRLLALVSVDLLGLFKDDIDAIRREAERKTGRDDLNVIGASVHNHSAPDTYGAYGGVPESYKRFLHDRASDAIDAAVRGLAPAKIGFTTVALPELAFNHRDPNGPVDEKGTVATVEAEDGSVIATLLNFACHADILGKRNTLVTADFPGYFCRAVEEARGGTGIYFSGALADAYPSATINDPEDERGLRTYEEAERVGKVLADAVLKGLPSAQFVSSAGIRIQKASIDLPVSNWILHVMRWMRIFKRSLHRGKVRTESWLVEINGAQMLTVPGQAFCQIGLELKKALPGPHRFLFGLAQDELAYIVPPELWDPKRRGEEEVATLGKGTWPALRASLPLPSAPPAEPPP